MEDKRLKEWDDLFIQFKQLQVEWAMFFKQVRDILAHDGVNPCEKMRETVRNLLYTDFRALQRRRKPLHADLRQFLMRYNRKQCEFLF